MHLAVGYKTLVVWEGHVTHFSAVGRERGPFDFEVGTFRLRPVKGRVKCQVVGRYFDRVQGGRVDACVKFTHVKMNLAG